MDRLLRSFGFGLCLVIVSGAGVTHAASPKNLDKTLALKHGTWVTDGVACEGAPNAAILFWDGKGFSGEHASSCVTRLLGQQGDRFTISTTCDALGDGSPAKPYSEERAFQRRSATELEFVDGKGPGTYHWCSGRRAQ